MPCCCCCCCCRRASSSIGYSNVEKEVAGDTHIALIALTTTRRMGRILSESFIKLLLLFQYLLSFDAFVEDLPSLATEPPTSSHETRPSWIALPSTLQVTPLKPKVGNGEDDGINGSNLPLRVTGHNSSDVLRNGTKEEEEEEKEKVISSNCPASCFRPNPVCGVNGITYWCGEVDAKCAGVGVESVGYCRIGSRDDISGKGILAEQSLLLVHMIWLMLAALLVLLGLP